MRFRPMELALCSLVGSGEVRMKLGARRLSVSSTRRKGKSGLARGPVVGRATGASDSELPEMEV